MSEIGHGRRAVGVFHREQVELARGALIMAAIAERHNIGMLHDDGDCDILADKTDLDFAGVWLAPRGSI